MTTLIGVESVRPSSARGVRASSPERDLAPTNVASGVSAVAVYLDVPGSPPADPAETTTRPHRSASSASAAPPLNRFTDLPFLWGGAPLPRRIRARSAREPREPTGTPGRFQPAPAGVVAQLPCGL